MQTAVFGGGVTLGSAVAFTVGAALVASVIYFGQSVLAGKHDAGGALSYASADAQSHAPRCELSVADSAAQLRIEVRTNTDNCVLSYTRNGTEHYRKMTVDTSKVVESSLPGEYRIVLEHGSQREERTVRIG